MLYDWDETKNAKNRAKHGIGFEQVVQAIDKNGILAVTDNPPHPGQELIVFKMAGKIYVAAVEERDGKVRIITAPRRRKMEKRYGP